MKTDTMYRCRHCGALVNPAFAVDSPATHSGAEGTITDPRSPGDHQRCCDQCCYGDERCAAEKATGGGR